MYVGNLKPHKNLERLLESYSKIKNIEDTRLVLVGKAFEKYDVLEEKEKKLHINKKVIHTGVVTKEELVDLYNLADLFVFPSLYEGFGIPVLEALACGTPVICSNTSSIPEVGGKVVEYFNPNNNEEITKKINKLINEKHGSSQKYKEDDIDNWLEKFKWSKTAKRHLKILTNNDKE